MTGTITKITSEGVWAKEDNPLDEPNINDFKSFPFCESGDYKAYRDSIKEWQEAEDNKKEYEIDGMYKVEGNWYYPNTMIAFEGDRIIGDLKDGKIVNVKLINK